MSLNENDCTDFRTLSLQLFLNEVVIRFKRGTESFDKYGSEVRGILTSRIWGDVIEQGEKKETVIALVIKTGSVETAYPCSDMSSLEDANAK